MTKLLFILIAAFVAYWIIKSYKRKKTKPQGTSAAHGEDMVRCAQCGVHLPRSESLMTGQLFYCTAEHRRLHERSQ